MRVPQYHCIDASVVVQYYQNERKALFMYKVELSEGPRSEYRRKDIIQFRSTAEERKESKW